MVSAAGIVGTVLSLVGLIIVILQATLKEFVNVSMKTNDGQSCDFAKLGVYETSYDSSCLTPEALTSSRVPDETYTSPTTHFKLLFPAQQNLIAEVLPTTPDVLTTFDAFSNGAASSLLTPSITAINTQTFDTCDQYMADTEANLRALFTPLNDILLPGVIPIVIKSGLDSTVAAFEASLLPLLSSAGNPFTAVMQASLSLSPSIAACGGADVASGSIDASQAQCISQRFGELQSAPTLASLAPMMNFMENVYAACAGAIQTATVPAATCLGLPRTIIDGEVILFGSSDNMKGASPLAVPFCALYECDGATTTVLGALQLLFPAMALIGQSSTEIAQLQAGMTSFLGVVQFLAPAIIANGGDTDGMMAALRSFQTGENVTAPAFPESFDEFYLPCGLIQLGAQQAAAGGNGVDYPSLGLEFTAGECSFGDFFLYASIFTGTSGDETLSSTSPLLGLLAQLYGGCESVGSQPRDCDEFFPSVFIDGVYQRGLNLTEFAFDKEAVFDQAAAACEDDEEDFAAMSSAQGLMAFSIFAYAATALLGAGGAATGGAPLMFVSALFGVAAVGTNVGALLQVQGAPVYDSVGEETELFEPEYKTGIVPTLLMVTLVVELLACIAFIAGGVMESKKGGDGGSGEAAEGEGEKKDPVAEVVPAEEAKPSV